MPRVRFKIMAEYFPQLITLCQVFLSQYGRKWLNLPLNLCMDIKKKGLHPTQTDNGGKELSNQFWSHSCRSIVLLKQAGACIRDTRSVINVKSGLLGSSWDNSRGVRDQLGQTIQRQRKPRVIINF